MTKQRWRFAIDVREAVGQWAGKGRYVVGLLQGLAEINDPDVEFLLYTRAPLPSDLVRPRRSTEVLLPQARIPGLRPLWQAFDMRRRGTGAFLSPTGYLPVLTSLVPTIPVIHDLAVWRMPGHQIWTVLNEKLLIRPALWRAASFLAVSAHTASDLVQLFHIDRARITVTHLGYDARYRRLVPSEKDDRAELGRVRDFYQLPAQFLLFVGTLEPRKNITRLIEAYHLLPMSVRQTTPLVIVGKKGWRYTEIFARVKDLGEEENIRFLGYVPDLDLPALYNLATVAVYPSLYEGFGLPALEALACGVPLVTSTTSSLPEVVGEAAVTVDPNNSDAIARQLEILLTDPTRREQLRRQGLERARAFSWVKCADLTLATLKEAASTSR